MPIPNIAVATPGVVLLPIHLPGQYSADVTAAARLKLPFAARVLGISVSARASGGATPTLGVDIEDDGASILTEAVSVTEGQVAEASIEASKAALDDESVLTVDLAITGTTPTWDDVDVLITLARI